MHKKLDILVLIVTQVDSGMGEGSVIGVIPHDLMPREMSGAPLETCELWTPCIKERCSCCIQILLTAVCYSCCHPLSSIAYDCLHAYRL